MIATNELYIKGSGLEATGSWQELGGSTNADGFVTEGDSLSLGRTDTYTCWVVWDDGTLELPYSKASGGYQPSEPETNNQCNEEWETTEAPDAVAQYLAESNSYDGLVDWTGKSEVTVQVGACRYGFSFFPAAIQIDPGTTVRWEWTGRGGTHNIVAESGDFESELVAEKGATFTQTFAETGTWRYYCAPHKSLGMKGAIVVEG